MERFCRGIASKSICVRGNAAKCPSLVGQCRFATSSSSSAVARGASRRLYRILQRQCVAFAKALPSHDSGESLFLFQPALNPLQAGTHRILSVKTVAPEGNDVRNLLVFFRDWNEDNDEEDAHDWYEAIQKDESENSSDDALDRDFTDEPTLWTTVSSIQKTIRYAFRHTKYPTEGDANPKFRGLMNKYAICAVRMMLEQEEIGRLSSVSYDKDIRVVATSKHIGSSYMGPKRRIAEMKNRFNYRIRIENLSDQETVQVLGRYWHIQELESREGEDEEVGDPIIVDAPNSGAGKPVGTRCLAVQRDDWC